MQGVHTSDSEWQLREATAEQGQRLLQPPKTNEQKWLNEIINVKLALKLLITITVGYYCYQEFPSRVSSSLVVVQREICSMGKRIILDVIWI